MMERPLFINRSNKHIFAVIHTPDKVTSKKGIIFLHPYAEEKQRVDRILVNCARHLCSNGYFVIRFDFFGCGDSEGGFEELSEESQISDLRTITEYFLGATDVEKIYLFGVRLGANIALQYAGIANNIEGIILWSPIMNGADYAETLLRNKIFSSFLDKKHKITKEEIIDELNENGRVDIDGFYLTKKYYDYLNNLDNITNSSMLHCDGFIGITITEGKVIDKYSGLTNMFEKNGNRCCLVPTEDRLYWDQRAHYMLYSPNNLVEKTLDYIVRL